MGLKKAFALAAIVICLLGCQGKTSYVENAYFVNDFTLELPERPESLRFEKESIAVQGEIRETPKSEVGVLSSECKDTTFTLKLYEPESCWELVGNLPDWQGLGADEIWRESIANECMKITEADPASVEELVIDGQPAVICRAKNQDGAMQYCLMIRDPEGSGCMYLQVLNGSQSQNEKIEEILQHVIDTFHWAGHDA